MKKILFHELFLVKKIHHRSSSRNMRATSSLVNEHRQRSKMNFSKSMAWRTLFVYIYMYLETWSSFGRNSYRPIYTSRYQKLSFLSRSNVIRDVDSRRGGESNWVDGNYRSYSLSWGNDAAKFKIRSTYVEDKAGYSLLLLLLVIRLPFHPWLASFLNCITY